MQALPGGHRRQRPVTESIAAAERLAVAAAPKRGVQGIATAPEHILTIVVEDYVGILVRTCAFAAGIEIDFPGSSFGRIAQTHGTRQASGTTKIVGSCGRIAQIPRL